MLDFSRNSDHLYRLHNTSRRTHDMTVSKNDVFAETPATRRSIVKVARRVLSVFADSRHTRVASHSALHFLRPGCRFSSGSETAQVRASRYNRFRGK
jgi:hypothetical protein